MSDTVAETFGVKKWVKGGYTMNARNFTFQVKGSEAQVILRIGNSVSVALRNT